MPKAVLVMSSGALQISNVLRGHGGERLNSLTKGEEDRSDSSNIRQQYQRILRSRLVEVGLTMIARGSV